LEAQSRVISALVLRESKSRFSGDAIGVFWAVIEPIAMIAIFFLLWTFRGRTIEGMPVHLFLITGFLPFFIFRYAMMGARQAIKANRSLLAFSQVKPIDLIVARNIFDFMVISFVLTFLLLVVYIADQPFRIANPPMFIFIVIVLLAIGFGLGCIIASLASYFPVVDRIVSIIVGRPLFFLSGLFFTANMLPDFALDYLKYNPLLHAIELGRVYFFVGYETPIGTLIFPVLTALGLNAIGLMFLSAMKKHLYVERTVIT